MTSIYACPALSSRTTPSIRAGDSVSYNVALQAHVLCRSTVLVGDLRHVRDSRNSCEPRRTRPRAFASQAQDSGLTGCSPSLHQPDGETPQIIRGMCRMPPI